MKRQQQPVGDLCPADPSHGPLLEVDGKLYCPHQAHDGRPNTHPEGAAPWTSPWPEKVPA